jgi:excisionase family DNA binding protein
MPSPDDAQAQPGMPKNSSADPPGKSTPRFLTVEEVARMMRVSKMTVYRLVHSGELEAIRIGRSFRIPEAAVTAYLDGAVVVPDEPPL